MSDNLQRKFVGGEALSQSLERLVESVSPALRRRLQQKGVAEEELEDLHIEAQVRLFAALKRRSRQDESSQINIEDPTRYAHAVADTVFDDYLRRMYPNRCRLKRRVLYLLDNTQTEKKVFARWKHRTAWIAGFTRWQQHAFRPSARYHAFCNRPDVFCQQELDDQEPEKMPLHILMAHLFRWLGTPVELEELISHLIKLQKITETRALPIEDMVEKTGMDMDHWLPPSPEDVSARVLDSIEGETFRAHLWQLLCSLPVRQRHALLLGMSSDELLLTGTMSDIADLLELPLAALSDCWPDLPFSDTQLAQRLELTPKQVSNLRKCARQKIARNLKCGTEQP